MCKKLYLFTLIILLTGLSWKQNRSFAQTTWNGSNNSEWTNPANWSDGVPDIADPVIIPDVKNDPVISIAGALTYNLSVAHGGVLTIAETGSLTVSGGGAQGVENSGTVSNSGNIDISVASTYGIRNLGTFNNSGGSITINNSFMGGIINSSGSFSNTGKISIGNAAGGGQNGVFNDAIFENGVGGQINIDRAGQTALINNGGSFTNEGSIIIGALAESAWGLWNLARFDHFGGTIRIDQARNTGFYNRNGGTLNNKATIIIGATASTGSSGILNEGSLNNEKDGQISIDRATSTGFINEGTCNNTGGIIIGGIASTGRIGLANEANINNNAGGLIKIDRFSEKGIENADAFSNLGTLTIGSTGTSGADGIYNRSVFNNNPGGQINIDRCQLLNIAGTFTNQAAITLGATASPGSVAFRNLATFINDTGGQMSIDRSTLVGIVNYSGAAFTNHAAIDIGKTAGAGRVGIQNNANLSNAAGEITIINAVSNGIENTVGATFRNLARITVNAVSSTGAFIQTVGNFDNISGEIVVNGLALYGIQVSVGGVFTNTTSITICSTSGQTSRGIQNSGTFNNNAGSQIHIDRSSDAGIYNSGNFSNTADIIVGSIASPGRDGIFNNSDFDNNFRGTIKIDASTRYGINDEESFTNNATLTIGSTSGVGEAGIRAFGRFINNGEINIDRTTWTGLAVIGTTRFINSGTVRIGANAGVGQYGMYLDRGLFTAELTSQVHIDNAGIGIYATNNGSISNLGDFTIGALAPMKDLIELPGSITSVPLFFHYRGTLKGSGTISSGVLCRGGNLAPGYSPGIMNFDSPDNEFSSGAFIMEINGTGTAGVDYDQIIALDNINISGMRLALSINYTPLFGDKVVILSAINIRNKFVEITGLPENWYVNYTPTSVILNYGSGPLPVSLVSFSGKKIKENENFLQWITADEKDFARFDIQRSEDAKNFETIGNVSGQDLAAETGTSQSEQALHAYTFTDNHPGVSNYYRLKMIDLDGTFKYSRIISIGNAAERAVVGSFYPNPSKGEAFIDLFATESGRCTLTIFDAAGKKLGMEVRELQKGMNKISLKQLWPGVNLVQFQHGLFSDVRKVILSH